MGAPRLNNGEIWLANLNPGRGTEPGKLRPVVVVQGQPLLDAGHPTTLILPLTANLVEDAEPLRVRVAARDGLEQDSDLLVDQLRAIDNRRLAAGPMTRLSDEEMRHVLRAIVDILE
jgi:mRNA interferase MazF